MAGFAVSLLIPLFAALFLYWLLKWWRVKHTIDKIPGRAQSKIPLVGSIFNVEVNSHDFLEQLVKECGIIDNPRMFRIWFTAAFPLVIIYGADEAKAVLTSTKFINKANLYNLLHPWLGQGLLTSRAIMWKPRRKLLTPTFHYEILKGFVDVFNQQAKILVHKLAKNCTSGNVDVGPYVNLCTLDIICETAMGNSIKAQDNTDSDYVKAIHLINTIVHERQIQPWFWPNVLFQIFGRGKEHDHCLKVLHGFTESVIKERRQERANDKTADCGKNRLAFLDLLLGMVDDGKLSLEDVRNEVDTFMFEGHDTTYAAINWCLYLMGTDMNVQERAQREIDALFADQQKKEISHKDLNELPYLECCIKEALRIFPSVPLFARIAEADSLIGEYHVPAGTQVVVIPFVVHRDASHWPNPEKFDPDRFKPEVSENRHPFAYLPFSAGSRNCIGQRFALMEEKTVLAWVLRSFTVRASYAREDIRPRADLILRPCEKVKLQLTQRQNLSV